METAGITEESIRLQMMEPQNFILLQQELVLPTLLSLIRKETPYILETILRKKYSTPSHVANVHTPSTCTVPAITDIKEALASE